MGTTGSDFSLFFLFHSECMSVYEIRSPSGSNRHAGRHRKFHTSRGLSFSLFSSDKNSCSADALG
jgi:hypothetical protein